MQNVTGTVIKQIASKADLLLTTSAYSRFDTSPLYEAHCKPPCGAAVGTTTYAEPVDESFYRTPTLINR